MKAAEGTQPVMSDLRDLVNSKGLEKRFSKLEKQGLRRIQALMSPVFEDKMQVAPLHREPISAASLVDRTKRSFLHI